MSEQGITINCDRLQARLEQLGEIGALEGGGVSRLALTDADKLGRDLVVGWMQQLGLKVKVDAIGNVVGVLAGESDAPCIMMGSHIDTVSTAGLFDGNLGVLAGIEVIETLIESGITPTRPIAVGFFTNEEGSRFAPDMMGSGVFTSALSLDVALQTQGIDGAVVADELKRIGYNGSDKFAPTHKWVSMFLELHIEQGPVLDELGMEIGIVEGVQGISWQEFTLTGVSNHAGTTPMAYRHDAGLVAAKVMTFAHQLANEISPTQLATVGALELAPNLINVIPHTAKFTVDLRNCDEQQLKQAETQLLDYLTEQAKAHGLAIERKVLARFEPVPFNPQLVSRIETLAKAKGQACQRMYSGAGHDAQMFAPHCPTAMIFVPSQGGISHNINEYTAPEQIAKGANLLLETVLEFACESKEIAACPEV
ncbi:Zn-dependent hydrolase [Vibrio sp. WXL210]|uniref:Zn-dependent hydrolase n=1 Tax=Vibrio sp. WXL210 TaxID=3450709 RepID=UPI003EC944D1